MRKYFCCQGDLDGTADGQQEAGRIDRRRSAPEKAAAVAAACQQLGGTVEIVEHHDSPAHVGLSIALIVDDIRSGTVRCPLQ